MVSMQFHTIDELSWFGWQRGLLYVCVFEKEMDKNLLAAFPAPEPFEIVVGISAKDQQELVSQLPSSPKLLYIISWLSDPVDSVSEVGKVPSFVDRSRQAFADLYHLRCADGDAQEWSHLKETMVRYPRVERGWDPPSVPEQ